MAGAGVVEVNDGNFEQEVLRSDLPVLVDFWAVWCGPCKAIGPTLESVAANFAGKLKVVKVNVDENAAAPSRYRIQAIPALMFFKDGKPVDQLIGFHPQEEIEGIVKRLVTTNGVAQSA
jgi:thioredoxin 1